MPHRRTSDLSTLSESWALVRLGHPGTPGRHRRLVLLTAAVTSHGAVKHYRGVIPAAGGASDRPVRVDPKAIIRFADTPAACLHPAREARH